MSYDVEADGVMVRQRVGRNASLATSRALSSFPLETTDELVLRMVDMFKKPLEKIDYLNSPRFAHDLMQLGMRVRAVYEKEPRCVFVESPCYVFGDIHGNLEDLNFFADSLWRLGIPLTAGRFLFLGKLVNDLVVALPSYAPETDHGAGRLMLLSQVTTWTVAFWVWSAWPICLLSSCLAPISSLCSEATMRPVMSTDGRTTTVTAPSSDNARPALALTSVSDGWMNGRLVRRLVWLSNRLADK